MIKTFTADQLGELSTTAASLPRQRSNLNIHASHDAEVQRLFLAFEPNTYVRPHKHPQAHKWELFVLLKGDIGLLTFDDGGAVSHCLRLNPRACLAAEIPANTWHSYISLAPGSIGLEIKEGAPMYHGRPDRRFHAWKKMLE